MIDPEQYIKVLCEDCDTRHASSDVCPFEKAFQDFVSQNYLGGDSEPIGRDWFREEIWNEGKR